MFIKLQLCLQMASLQKLGIESNWVVLKACRPLGWHAFNTPLSRILSSFHWEIFANSSVICLMASLKLFCVILIWLLPHLFTIILVCKFNLMIDLGRWYLQSRHTLPHSYDTSVFFFCLWYGDGCCMHKKFELLVNVRSSNSMVFCIESSRIESSRSCIIMNFSWVHEF